MSRRILVIEDSPELADLLRLHLQDCDAVVDVETTGTAGLTRATHGNYQLIVLDIMLPGINGLEVCRRIREGPSYVPILMLTAKSTETDRVVGLEMGADDYLTKPFSLRELVARVRAIFRRLDALGSGGAERPGTVERGPLRIDKDGRTAHLGEKELNLTAKEFDLLWEFALHPGRVYRREQLLDRVWGGGYQGYEHTVNSHINRLRAKIEDDPAKPRYILTVWGVGYKFNDQRGPG